MHRLVGETAHCDRDDSAILRGQACSFPAAAHSSRARCRMPSFLADGHIHRDLVRLACGERGGGAEAPDAFPTPAAAARLTASIVQTTADLHDALKGMPSRVFAKTPARGAQIISVNDTVHEQSITGFGGTMTDTAAWLLHDELTPRQRAHAMRDLFSSSGLALNQVRIPMGASDFTVYGAPYTYDDMPTGQADPTLAHFSIAHDLPYIIPMLREMLTVNPHVETYANPWTAPPWMKANDSYNDLGRGGYVLSADEQMLANYFVKFIVAYTEQGVHIDAITPMNEPNSGALFPATYLMPSEATFIAEDLAPTLAANGLRPRSGGGRQRPQAVVR